MWANLVCIAALVVSTTARLDFGSCKTYSAEQSFSMIHFAKKWYVQYSFDRESDSCITTNYQIVNTSYTQFNIHTIGVNKWTNKTSTIDGIAVLKDSRANEGVFKVSFSNFWSWWNTPRDYVVMATDYYNYAVVYTCSTKLWLFQSRKFWILTRTPYASSLELNGARKVLYDNGIVMSEFYEINHANCTYNEWWK